MSSFSKFILVAAAALLASTAVRAETAEEKAEWEKVVAAAKKEGEVTVYTGQIGVPMTPEINKLFEKKYGIKVKILEARASELQERIRTEQTTGRVSGDFSHNGGSSAVFLERSGFYQKHGYLPNLGKLQDRFKSNGVQFSFFVQSYGVVVNASVPEAERPKSWNDLLDPKWKGKILADDFRALGGGSAFFNVTFHKLGRGFHEKLAQQNIVFSRQIRDNPRRVARGEFLIYIPFSMADMQLNEGLPIAPIVPAEGNPYITYDAAVFNNAPHPNAAKVMLNFYLEDEVQMIYVRSGRGHTIKGLDDRVPAELKPLINVKLMGKPDPDTTQQTLAAAKEIYK